MWLNFILKNIFKIVLTYIFQKCILFLHHEREAMKKTMKYSYTIYGWTKTLGVYGRDEGKQCEPMGKAVRLVKVLLKKYDRVSIVEDMYFERRKICATTERKK